MSTGLAGIAIAMQQLLLAWITSRYEVYKDKRYYGEKNAETGQKEQVLAGVKS